VNTSAPSSFLARHEFLVRRLHSLTGLIPVGAYMVVHLVVNASLMSGASTFQKNVYQIHSLEDALLLVEWAFIFLPILFHGLFGLVIIWGGLSNTGSYPYVSNIRYTVQRATGIIALLFIVCHVFHLHGWFHFEGWLTAVAEPLGGAKFKPFNAASTLGMAMSSLVVQVLYAVGVLACVYHLANGLWTMGITWGLWTSPAAQQRASKACAGFGVLLAAAGMVALFAASTVNVGKAEKIEVEMYEARTKSGDIKENPHKLSTSQAGDSRGGEVAIGPGS
jgi:succinate dehydrogenase / fumarate reductase cytochrome b subunit